jgi:protein suppressor of PHYA-105 1
VDPAEEALYASPEELLSGGAAASPKSDVYSLGVLFFELFNPVNDDVERSRALQALRHRILPPQVLQVITDAVIKLWADTINLAFARG